MTESNLASKVA